MIKFLSIFIFLIGTAMAQNIEHIKAVEIIAEFKEVAVDLFYQVFPQDHQLQITLNWQENRQNLGGAYTRGWKEGEIYYREIIIEGGLIRHPFITAQAIPIVLCHELGHHMARKFTQYESLFSTYNVEMIIDYFATSVCLPKLLESPYFLALFENKENQNILEYHYPEQATLLEQQFPSRKEQSVVGALFSLALYLHDFFAPHSLMERNQHGNPTVLRRPLHHESDFAQCTFEAYKQGFFQQKLHDCALKN